MRRHPSGIDERVRPPRTTAHRPASRQEPELTADPPPTSRRPRRPGPAQPARPARAGGTRPGIDLHAHSTASDGLLTPEELVRRAAETGLRVLALTDHDTTAGIERAAAVLPDGLTLLPGAEISCYAMVGGRRVSMHILAYLFDPAEPEFAAARARLRDSRATRARRIVEKIAADGHPVTWERVRQLARGAVGRPHIAAALLEAGLVRSIDEAFTPDWIGSGGRYSATKDEPDVWETLRLIRGAGGVSVFAHPFASARGAIVTEQTVADMAGAGLVGIEVDHPDHPPATRDRLRALAAELGLVTTGSSDFHGTSKPQGLGAEMTSPEAYEAIVAAATGASPITRESAAALGPTGD